MAEVSAKLLLADGLSRAIGEEAIGSSSSLSYWPSCTNGEGSLS